MSRLRRQGAWIALACLAAGASPWGCRQNPPQRPPEVRIAEAVDEKLAAWRQRRRTECRRVALAEAQLQADTLVMDYALAKRLENPRPARPIRPDEPPLLRPDDTLRLDPFRADTLIRDGELPRRRTRGVIGANADTASRADTAIRGDVSQATSGAAVEIAAELKSAAPGSGHLDSLGEGVRPPSDTALASDTEPPAPVLKPVPADSASVD